MEYRLTRPITINGVVYAFGATLPVDLLSAGALQSALAAGYVIPADQQMPDQPVTTSLERELGVQ